MKQCPVCNTQLPDDDMQCPTCQFSFHPMLGVSPEEANRMLEEKRDAYRKQDEELSQQSKDYLCGIRAFGSHEHRSVVSLIVLVLGIAGPICVLPLIKDSDNSFLLLFAYILLSPLFFKLGEDSVKTRSCISYLIVMAFWLLSSAWSIISLLKLLKQF